MPLTPGTRLGTYEIIAPLGAGGMGEVYRARDLRLGREIALKVLPAEVAADAERLARFEREARTVAGLNHPNIVTLHSVEDEGDVRFLTMELVEGKSLDRLVAPGGLPLARVLELAIPLADALVASHEKGVIHRDLKPANVMVTADGRVKVLDFGLARWMPSPAQIESAVTEELRTRTGVVMGTAPYMAPEQIRGEPPDARSDLFSFGVLLYELLAGRRPFAGASAIEVSAAILQQSPPPLGAARTDLPPDLERIVGRCLEKGVRERFQTALDLSNELRHLRTALTSPAPRATESRTAEGIASIAVLPFVNRSHDEADEYFSDGLADELLTMLTKIKGLRVSARASSFHFRGKDVPLAEIGRTLNVTSILDGSVRRAGNRVRISVQLVTVDGGYHLWSETYDRVLDDIFAVQDDIAHSVVKTLRAKFLDASKDAPATGALREEVARAAKGRGTDPEAHRLCLLARHALDRSSRDSTAKATEYLAQAIALDPGYAQAWALLSQAHSLIAGRGWSSYDEGYEKAREAAERALALEPDLAEAHAHLGWVRIYRDRDWRGAEASYARALELAPANDLVLRGAATLAFDLGRVDEAIRLNQQALERDPLGSAGYNVLGLALHRAERLAEGEAAFRRALELAPQRATTHANLAITLAAQGRLDEAVAEVEAEPAAWARLLAGAIVHHARGDEAASRAALDELIAGHGDHAAYQIAEAHGARGERDQAFEWLRRAEEIRDPGLAEMKKSPCFRSLHGDPRWSAFLQRMGLAT